MSDAYRPPREDSDPSPDESPETKRGRILVLIVIVLTLADALFQAAVAGRVVRALAVAAVSLFLYRGLMWARFVLILALSISSGYTLWAFEFRASGWTFWSVYAALGIVTHVASVIILLSSKDVERFLSRQRG